MTDFSIQSRIEKNRLAWSDWVPFDENRTHLKGLPNTPGLYQIRRVSAEDLCYIGETGRNLRERLGSALTGMTKEVMPFNDPHTAAPGLWCYRQEGYQFECRAAPVELTRRDRRALETCLIWQHRLEFGYSPLCNLGRFHPNFTRSGSRKSGQRGRYLSDNEPRNPAGFPSISPLNATGETIGQDWMGLKWTTFSPLNQSTPPKSAGLYRILVKGLLVYLGESEHLRNRIIAHRKRDWGGVATISYWSFAAPPPHHHRLEIENDLIAGYIQAHGVPPYFQYGP